MTVPPGQPGPTAATGHFDVCGPLPPTGVTVLEASAGTGKTFTIAALVTRFVADGIPVSQILAVTFTRMATSELRDRIRSRLVSAEAGLARFLGANEPCPPDDALVALLAAGTPEEIAARRDRLGTAVASFDEATITTTHGFCQLMLTGLGVAGDVATAATLLEDPRDVIEQVVDDLYVRWTLRHGEPPTFTRSDAVAVAQAAVANPDTPLVSEDDGSPADLRRRLADRARLEVRRRLSEDNLLTFDDLLVRLKDTLHDPERGPAACARLRSRYSVVLVDEFQDTDPIQWDVVRTAFGTGQTRLVLIGDPKQAIYAFRGADVYAYLDAARLAARRFTLGENWRSDAGLLRALDAVFDPLRLGHPDIPFRPVRAAPCNRWPGLRGAPAAEPLRARLVPTRGLLPTTSRGEVTKSAAVAFIATDVAADIVTLLASGAEVVGYDDEGAERTARRLSPGDVAVLVGTNRQAGMVQEALRAAGVPAVVAGTDSVFATPAARDWLALLEAVEQPSSRARAVAVGLTPFLGMSADEVAGAGEADWEGVHARLNRWGETLRQRGVASLFRTVSAGEDLPGRVLRARDGERRLTDLGHVARLLHTETSASQHGPPALRAWLARRIDEAGTGRDGVQVEERSRWIDSDADAVQVLTVHRAKGLQFPVVYCPFLWDEVAPRKGRPVVFHDPDDGMQRLLDVAGADGGPSYDLHFELQRAEERGEALRELYVAVTRARHQVVMWWVRCKDANHSALGRMLTVRDQDGNVATSSRRMPRDEDVTAAFEAMAARAGGLIGVETPGASGRPGVGWPRRADTDTGSLGIARFSRPLDLRWRRTSYSGVTALVHGGPEVGSDPEEPGTTDEPLAGAPAELVGDDARAAAGADGESLLRAVPSGWSGLPGGVEMGTFVHSVLEAADFAAADTAAEILRAIDGVRYAVPGAPLPAGQMAEALSACVTTPLGPLAGGTTLRAIGRADRLDELEFELPLAGGDRPGDRGPVDTADIAALFDLHEPSGPGAVLVGYGQRLRDPLLGTDLRGYLTGSLDLVFRTGAGAGPPRWFVADYKTNWIGAPGEELSAWHCRPAVLDMEMQRMHYPLQAVFYLVALHRYLRWRLRGYDPDTHLGGVLYLFLRGMLGPETPLVGGAPCGVFAWRPPTALVTDLSDLFEAGS